MDTRKFIAFFFLTILLDSCVSLAEKNLQSSITRVQTQASPNRPFFDDRLINGKEKTVENLSGSLWSNNYTSRLYDNMYRASKLGDTVMIVVDERTQGTNKGDTKADRKSEYDSSIDEVGGVMTKLGQILQTFNPAKLLSAKSEGKFKGNASTNREGELTAKISATVVQVLNNGNMVVRGEKHLKINKEDQVLIIEGIIRPYDISPDNMVLSSALADARISYSGFGIVAEKQSPGWLVRALDIVWPF